MASHAEIAGWSDLRKAVIERDNHRCRICGRDGVEAKLNVHHKDICRDHNYYSNLVTLCSDCHQAIHREGYQPILFEDWPVPWGDDPE